MTSIDAETFLGGVGWALTGSDEERRVDLGRALDDRWAETFVAAAAVSRRQKTELEEQRAQTRVHVAQIEHLSRRLQRAQAGRVAHTTESTDAAVRRPKVFVVTPSFNQGRYLRETIESVLGQDYENLDYFVCDGGSTDDSLDVLRSYGDRVRWTSGPDGGQAAAIARAWTETDAEIVAWLNSDDTYLEGAISKAVDYLQSHPDVAMVYGDAWHTDAAGRQLRRYPTRPFDRQALAGECFICQPATFLRREVFRVVEVPDATLRYCMDYDLWIRISRHFQVGYLQGFLATSRLHMENKTLGERDGLFREAMRVARGHFGSVHPSWRLAYAEYRFKRLSARLWMLPEPLRRLTSRLLANGLVGRLVGPPYDDGWARRRTLVPVECDESGWMSVEGDCPVWPYARTMRITASCEGRVLAIRHVRGPSRFSLPIRLPPSLRSDASVLLEADRWFSPLQLGLSDDSRVVSFRILEVRRGRAGTLEELRLSDRWVRVSSRLRFVPARLQRRVSELIARLVERPVEGKLYDDGWAGPRTMVPVRPDAAGDVTLACDCPVWPYSRPLRITAYHDGKAVTAQTIEGPGRFALSFRLARARSTPETVLLVANRSFVPLRHGLSEDRRFLSFRILDPAQ